MAGLLGSKKTQWFILVGVLLVILVLFCLNATRSALWYDETIEYYYSKVANGPVPGGRATENMYERITETFQPPLYNWLMHLWLMAFDTEFGFRLAGILTTMIGAIGLFLAMRKIAGYPYALFGTAAYLLTGRVADYTLECAEYNLLLCFVCWTLFFFLCSITDGETKHLAGFFLFSCLSVYSQYGAVFIILPLFGIVIIHFLRKREKVKELLLFTGLAAVAAVLLIVCFLLPQLNSQGTTGVSHSPVFLKGSFVADFLYHAAFCLGFTSGNTLSVVILCVCAAIAAITPFLVRDRKVRMILSRLLIAGACAWVAYYFAVACSFYGYNAWDGRLGTNNIVGRYFIFFTPLIMLIIVAEAYWFIKAVCDRRGAKDAVRRVISACLILLVLAYCGMGIRKVFNLRIKDDVREVEKVWTASGAYDGTTLVHEWTDANFQFYLTHDRAYDDHWQDHIVNTDRWIWYADKEEMIRKLSDAGIFKLDEFAYIGPYCDIAGSYYAFVTAAEELGYKVDLKYGGASALLFVSKNRPGDGGT